MSVLERLAFIREYSRVVYAPILAEQSARFLETSVEKLQPKRVLEIGTSIGYSGSVILLNSPECVLNTIDYNEKALRAAREHFTRLGVMDRVNIFSGDANEIVPLLTGAYDLIFVDGPKGQYLHFLPYLTGLMNAGSTLICDNVLFRGMVKSRPHKRHRQITLSRNLSEFIGALQSDARFETDVYEIGDGMSVSVRKKQ